MWHLIKMKNPEKASFSGWNRFKDEEGLAKKYSKYCHGDMKINGY